MTHRPLVFTFQDSAPPEDLHEELRRRRLLQVRLEPDLPGTRQQTVPWGELILVGFPSLSFDRYFQPLEDVTGQGNMATVVLRQIIARRGITSLWFHERELWNIVVAAVTGFSCVVVLLAGQELSTAESRPRWPTPMPGAEVLWSALGANPEGRESAQSVL